MARTPLISSAIKVKPNLSGDLNTLAETLLGSKKRGFAAASTFASDRYAYISKGKFVSEITFVKDSFDAIDNNKLPAEEGIVMVSLDSLYKKDPVAYLEWKNSGLPSDSWNDNAFKLMNKIIEQGKIDLQARYLSTVDTHVKGNRAVRAPETTRIDKLSYIDLINYLNSSNIPPGPPSKTFYIVYTNFLAVRFSAAFLNNKFAPVPPKGIPFLDDQLLSIERIYNENKILTAPKALLNTKVNRAHNKADTTSVIEYDINQYRVLLDSSSLSDGAKDAIRLAVQEGEIVLTDAEAYDKLKFDPGLTVKTASIETAIQNAEASLKGLLPFEVIVIGTATNGQVTSRSATVQIELNGKILKNDIDTISVEAANQGWNSGKLLVFKNRWQAITENLIKNEEIAKLVFVNEGSSSITTELLLKTLDKIFNTNEFSKAIKKAQKNRKFFYWKVKNTRKKVLENKSVSKINKHGKNFNNYLKKVSRIKNKQAIAKPLSISQTTQDIVPLINAELKRYVLEQMFYPSLENRSGRFASSVRVLSAQEDAAVQYTYMKSPYQVFSQAKGKSPWNDRQERDPAQIIDKAIKKIGMDKFGKVFRTEER